jgi:hypothetical protein
MKGDVVAGGVKIGERDQLGAGVLRDLGSDVRIVRQGAHAERAGAAHYFAADTAESDDPESLSAQLAAQEFLLLPLPGTRGGGRLGDVPRHRQHQGQRVFRHRDGVAAGGVHHQHACVGGGFEIDVIDADAGAANHSQLGSALEDGSIDLHRAADDEGIGAGKMRCKFFGAGDDDAPVGLRLEQLDAGGGKGFGDHDGVGHKRRSAVSAWQSRTQAKACGYYTPPGRRRHRRLGEPCGRSHSG